MLRQFIRCSLAPFSLKRCVLCELQRSEVAHLCIPCYQNLPWITQRYAKQSPFFHACTTPFNYTFPISEMLIQLKFNEKLLYAHILGSLLAHELIQYYQAHSPPPQLILPMPLHDVRLRQRGFNQAVELCRPISHMLDIRYAVHGCHRHKPTLPQSSLVAAKRHDNVKNAFRMTHDFHINHVLIVDDVMTTQATINELCHTLRRAGIDRIDIATVAQATPTIK